MILIVVAFILSIFGFSAVIDDTYKHADLAFNNARDAHYRITALQEKVADLQNEKDDLEYRLDAICYDYPAICE
ncbi:hypothetical protein [Asticcacaulis tiandongensis]|uniref:hypothetical protein n=1 Tax=Asticcacaulis tiandongensis TaxID=2565365 RepID=UPI001127E09A|nr:hypothetical protein [Asticcacaulis tiandongensis]